MADVRQRKKAEASASPPAKTPAALAKAEDRTGISLLDVLRTLTFVVLVSCALSYFITRKSFVWGVQRPQWSRVEVIKSYLVRSPFLPPSPLKPFPSLTDGGRKLTVLSMPTERTKAIHRRRPKSLRRQRPHRPPPPRHKRHHLRRLQRPQTLRARRLVPRLRGQRRISRLRNRLFRHRRHP